MINRNPKNKNTFNLFLNRYFNILLVALVILVLALAYFFLLRPKFDKTLQAIQDNIASQQRLYLEQQNKLANLRTVAELYKKIPVADLDKFNKVLPDDYVKE